MTTRNTSARASAARELRDLLAQCRDTLAKARLRGWKYHQVIDFSDLVLRDKPSTRPGYIGNLRTALMECELVVRLLLPPGHSAQRLATKAARAVLRTYPLSRNPPGPAHRAPRMSAVPQTY
ncbi:MAG: hypothetical protein M0038_09995 [Pseudomonadota bacterium]|jgi:hypothetical protein|nr:hypothetical protein [Pseudomonadota bacterium]